MAWVILAKWRAFVAIAVLSLGAQGRLIIVREEANEDPNQALSNALDALDGCVAPMYDIISETVSAHTEGHVGEQLEDHVDKAMSKLSGLPEAEKRAQVTLREASELAQFNKIGSVLKLNADVLPADALKEMHHVSDGVVSSLKSAGESVRGSGKSLKKLTTGIKDLGEHVALPSHPVRGESVQKAVDQIATKAKAANWHGAGSHLQHSVRSVGDLTKNSKWMEATAHTMVNALSNAMHSGAFGRKLKGINRKKSFRNDPNADYCTSHDYDLSCEAREHLHRRLKEVYNQLLSTNSRHSQLTSTLSSSPAARQLTAKAITNVLVRCEDTKEVIDARNAGKTIEKHTDAALLLRTTPSNGSYSVARHLSAALSSIEEAYANAGSSNHHLDYNIAENNTDKGDAPIGGRQKPPTEVVTEQSAPTGVGELRGSQYPTETQIMDSRNVSYAPTGHPSLRGASPSTHQASMYYPQPMSYRQVAYQPYEHPIQYAPNPQLPNTSSYPYLNPAMLSPFPMIDYFVPTTNTHDYNTILSNNLRDGQATIHDLNGAVAQLGASIGAPTLNLLNLPLYHPSPQQLQVQRLQAQQAHQYQAP